MLPTADEIADIVFAQLTKLGEEAEGEIVCVVARAMMRGCCRALQNHYDPEASGLSLEAWIAEALRAEGLAGQRLH